MLCCSYVGWFVRSLLDACQPVLFYLLLHDADDDDDIDDGNCLSFCKALHITFKFLSGYSSPLFVSMFLLLSMFSFSLSVC